MNSQLILEEINAEHTRYKTLYSKLCCMTSNDFDYDYCKHMIALTQKRIDQLLKQVEIINEL